MNKDLLLTATTFGLANSIFYVGYVACEIPSNLLMVRYGARVWIARILTSWGLASAATMLVVGPTASMPSGFWWACWRPASCRASCSI
jgi:ACS family 4-hydroxyphenylacetate permease-like MFS transporter